MIEFGGAILLGFFEGIALAMDAFSVSLANGLSEPCMKKTKLFSIALTFAAFQAVMPMIGWFCVTTVKAYFEEFQKFIPWIALVLLLFIGGKMLVEGIRGGEEVVCTRLTVAALMMQGVATSIDALSSGFTVDSYSFLQALVFVAVIAAVTFVICTAGLYLGRRFGTRLAGRAGMLGGIILIVIGIKIFVEGVIL